MGRASPGRAAAVLALLLAHAADCHRGVLRAGVRGPAAWRLAARSELSGERSPEDYELRMESFTAQDFVIERYIGEVGLREVTDWEYYGRAASPLDPNTPSRTSEDLGAGVRFFEGRTQLGTRVLLREYLPVAGQGAALAERELDARVRIYNRRNDAIRDGLVDPRTPLPCSALLGSLTAESGFQREDFLRSWQRTFPARVAPPKPGNMWLVYMWEGLTTAEVFPRIKQPQEPWSGLWPARVKRRRATFVRAIFDGALNALAECHEAGVAHGSIGLASLLLSTADETDVGALRVRLQDFGFFRPNSAAGLKMDEEAARRAERFGQKSAMQRETFLAREDLYSLAYAYLELLFATLVEADEGAPQRTDQDSLKRLIEDTFGDDVKGKFRSFAQGVPEWEPVVQELDGPEESQAGWELLDAMVNCRTLQQGLLTARGLLSSPYLRTDA